METKRQKWENRDPAANTLINGCVWLVLYAGAITLTLIGLFIGFRIIS